MKTEFTKGEWSINNWTQPDDTIAVGAVGTPLIARVHLRDVSINEQKANAKLITAAPRLLTMLNSLVLSVTAHPDYVMGEKGDEWHDIIEMCEDAIKKATE